MTEMSRESLGTAVQRARQRAQLSQEDLGALTDLGQTVVSRIESGVRKVDLVELLRIADALHTSVDEILTTAKALHADDVARSESETELELLALRLGDPSTPAQTREALRPVQDLVAALRQLESLAADRARG